MTAHSEQEIDMPSGLIERLHDVADRAMVEAGRPCAEHAKQALRNAASALREAATALAAAQEPVAWRWMAPDYSGFMYGIAHGDLPEHCHPIPLYTVPPGIVAALEEACAIGQSTILVRCPPPRSAYLDEKFNRLCELRNLPALPSGGK